MIVLEPELISVYTKATLDNLTIEVHISDRKMFNHQRQPFSIYNASSVSVIKQLQTYFTYITIIHKYIGYMRPSVVQGLL